MEVIKSVVLYGLSALVAFMIVYRILVFFEIKFAQRNSKPWVRYFLTYKKLNAIQKTVLETEFDFYKSLDDKNKRVFEHRVASFIRDKNFVGRKGMDITNQIQTLIGATAVMLTFGMRNYKYNLVEHILVYPGPFFSTMNEEMHQGEFNPAQKAMVFSWKHFIYGYQISNDNLNLGLHEFAHAFHMESIKHHNLTTIIFNKNYQSILKHLMNSKVKERIIQTKFFREYGFTNQFEFLAVLIEYFFESPAEFKTAFPVIYNHVKKMLSFNFGNW